MSALPFFLGHLRFSAACHAAGYPSRVPHLADSGWLPYSCGGRLAWGWGCLGTDVLFPTWFSTLCRRNSPFRFFPFGVLLVYSWGWVGGVFATSLGFSHVPCSSSGPAACAAFPAAGYLGVFPVTVCLSFSFACGVGWASALPFFF